MTSNIPRLQALAAALSSGAAPELILLDLRGNPVSDEGLEAMVCPGLGQPYDDTTRNALH